VSKIELFPVTDLNLVTNGWSDGSSRLHHVAFSYSVAHSDERQHDYDLQGSIAMAIGPVEFPCAVFFSQVGVALKGLKMELDSRRVCTEDLWAPLTRDEIDFNSGVEEEAKYKARLAIASLFGYETTTDDHELDGQLPLF